MHFLCSNLYPPSTPLFFTFTRVILRLFLRQPPLAETFSPPPPFSSPLWPATFFSPYFLRNVRGCRLIGNFGPLFSRSTLLKKHRCIHPSPPVFPSPLFIHIPSKRLNLFLFPLCVCPASSLFWTRGVFLENFLKRTAASLRSPSPDPDHDVDMHWKLYGVTTPQKSPPFWIPCFSPILVVLRVFSPRTFLMI